MIWLRSALVGLAAAVATIILTIAIVAAMALWWADIGATSGIGVFVVAISAAHLVPAIVAFALGFWWNMRRERQKHVAR